MAATVLAGVNKVFCCGAVGFGAGDASAGVEEENFELMLDIQELRLVGPLLDGSLESATSVLLFLPLKLGRLIECFAGDGDGDGAGAGAGA